MILVIPQIPFFTSETLKKYSKCEVLRDISRDYVIIRFTNFNLGCILKLGKMTLKMFIFPNPEETVLFLVVEEQEKSMDWIRLT